MLITVLNSVDAFMLRRFSSKKGMELVQVAILIAIAVGIGLIFKEKIKFFVDEVFKGLNAESFTGGYK